MLTETVKPLRIVYMTTVGTTAKAFLRGQLSWLQENGFEVTIVSSPGSELEWIGKQENVRILGIPMCREINLWSDLLSFWRIWRHLKRNPPDIISVGTPKASLLGLVAARIERVPVRIYEVRGLRLETTGGMKRALLSLMEKITAGCAHSIICDSSSLRQLYLRMGLAPAHKVSVLGDGSCNGVDPDRFLPHPELHRKTEELKIQLGLDRSHFVLGFVGRLTRDKGVEDLITVFKKLYEKYPMSRLLLIGDYEKEDPISQRIRDTIHQHPAILPVGLIDQVAPYYYLMDLLVFPSYREGFPCVPLEAGLAGIPTLGYRSTGVVDAVVDGRTGVLVPVGDRAMLLETLQQLMADPLTRNNLGMNARYHILEKYDQRDVWKRWVALYLECFHRVSSRCPK